MPSVPAHSRFSTYSLYALAGIARDRDSPFHRRGSPGSGVMHRCVAAPGRPSSLTVPGRQAPQARRSNSGTLRRSQATRMFVTRRERRGGSFPAASAPFPSVQIGLSHGLRPPPGNAPGWSSIRDPAHTVSTRQRASLTLGIPLQRSMRGVPRTVPLFDADHSAKVPS